MRLKELHLLGFKSFPDKTVIKFSEGITAILGPNGCGKTNILDALRWVLGEQSLSLLRCTKNEELIFAGTKTRPLVNFCEVKLILENNDPNSPFGSEIEIKRRYFRSGESEYYLNRNPCRLRDIEEIFFATGSKAYALFSLADIRRIIHGEVRQFFAEAANLKKYEENKRETLNKLDLAERDLTRLEDIIRERQRIVRSLARQKRRLQVYENLRQEEKRLKLIELKIKREAAEKKREILTAELSTRLAEEAELIKAIEKDERELDRLKEEIKNQEREQASAATEMLRLKEELELVEKERIKYQERLSFLKTAQEKLISAKEAIPNQIKEIEKILKEKEEKILKETEAEAAIKKKLEVWQKELKEIGEEIAQKERAKEEEEKKRAASFDAIIQIQSEIFEKEQELARWESQSSGEITSGEEDLRPIVEPDNLLGEVKVFLEWEAGYEKAIKAALFPYYSFFVLRCDHITPHPPLRDVGFIMKGTEPQEDRGWTYPEGLLPLRQVCRPKEGCPDLIRSILRETFLVSDYEKAREMRKDFPQFSFVTKEGILLKREGVIFLSGEKRDWVESEAETPSSLLSRKKDQEEIIAQAKKKRAEWKRIKKEREERIAQLEKEISSLKELEKERFNLSSNLLSEMTKRREEKKILLTEVQFLNEEKTKIYQKEEAIKQELEEIAREMEVIKEGWRLSEERQNSLRMVVTEKESVSSKSGLEENKKKREELEEALRQKRKELAIKQQEIQDKRLAEYALKKETEDIEREARLRFGMEISPEIEIIEGVEERLKEIEAKILNIGKVNPMAGEEYEREKEELNKFLQERQDCLTARVDLQKIIQELDTRLQEDFMATFEKVRVAFRDIFARLFQGGEADLLLAQPENPLASEIIIVAKPQGKNPKRLEQLSDGEKALLSLSLLFAFYQVKPAPFSFLDEIDAPLDDANVERFTAFLKEISKNTQVVIITHNRLTLEKVDVLLGVTSEEPGVSKIITIRLKDLNS